MQSKNNTLLNQQKAKQEILDKYLQESEDYFQLCASEDIQQSRLRIPPKLKDFTHDADGDEIQYKNNTSIKPKGCRLRLKQTHIDEYAFCSCRPIYTIKNYFKVVHQDYGIVNLDPYTFQEKIIQTTFKEKRTLVRVGRQAGKSTILVGFILFYCMFNKNKNIALVANKASTSKEILDRIKLAYTLAPHWLKPGVVKWNDNKVVFENGMTIIAAATTSSSIRGLAISLLYIDEISHIHPKMWKSFEASTFPVISSSKMAKIICTTTPKGRDHFWRMWDKSAKGKGAYKLIHVRWNEIPGRDEKWKQTTLMSECGGDEEVFSQEYDAQFIGESKSLVDSEVVDWVAQGIAQPVKKEGELWIYEQPKKGTDYVITCDVSEGKELDYSTIHVFRISSVPYKQVATYKSNKVDIVEFPGVIYQLAMRYNEAYVLIENNNMGVGVCKDLWVDYEYRNMFNLKQEKINQKTPAVFELGFRTSNKTKKLGEQYLKFLLKKSKIEIVDSRTLEEFNNLVYNPSNGCFEADDRNINDDLFAALRNLCYIIKTKKFDWIFQYCNEKPDVFKETVDEVKHLLSSFPIIRDDGKNPFLNRKTPDTQKKSGNDFNW